MTFSNNSTSDVNNANASKRTYTTGARKVLSSMGRSIRKMKITRSRSSRTTYEFEPRHSRDSNHYPNTDTFKSVCSGDDSEIEAGTQIGLLRNCRDTYHSYMEGNILSDGTRDPRRNDNYCLPNRSETTLYRWERYIRLTCLLLGSFVLGASYSPTGLVLASKLLEYSFVSWLTCVVIIFVSFWQPQEILSHDDILNTNIAQRYIAPTMEHIHQPQDECSESFDDSQNNIENDGVEEDDEGENTLINITKNVPESISPTSATTQNEMSGQHPDTRKLYIMRSDDIPQRIPPNTIVPFENDYCVGNVMIMVRTPDADEPLLNNSNNNNTSLNNDDAIPTNINNYGMNEEALKVSEYFRPKKRRFTCQFQVKLKEIPKGTVYMGIEFDEAIKMGIVQRALAHAALGFVKKTNRGFHFSLTGGDASNMFPDDKTSKAENGEYELPHMSFPIISCMDIIVATKPGDPLPPMNGDVYERPESIKSRKKGGMGDFPGWNLEHTYTMVVWSAYVDWLKWKCVNLPGIRPFSICSLCGNQPIKLTTYVFKGEDDERKPHFACDKTYLSELEFSSMGKTSGQTVKNWLALKEAEKSIPEYDAELLEDDDDDDDVDDGEDGVECDEVEDDNVVEELGGGMYLRCGDPILLREASQTIDSEINNPENEEDIDFLTNSFGFAVMQSQSTSNIIFEKAGASYQDPDRKNRSKSKLIRSGDIVRIKILTDKNEFKYLSLYKRWWLKWVAHVPRKNGYFKVFTNESEGDDALNNSVRSVEMQSTYLSIGGSFSLHHCSWPGFEVGIGVEGSSKFGGRMLGLHPVGHVGTKHIVDYDGFHEERQVAKGKENKPKFRSFRICAHNVSSALLEYSTGSEANDNQLNADMDNVRLDASAWIEMMHRTSRTRQRAYIVRVKHDDLDSQYNLDSNNNVQGNDLRNLTGIETSKLVKSDKTSGFEHDSKGPYMMKYIMRLRTGRDLAPLLQLSRSMNRSTAISSTRREESDAKEDADKDETKNDYYEPELNENANEVENELMYGTDEFQESEGQLTDAEDNVEDDPSTNEDGKILLSDNESTTRDTEIPDDLRDNTPMLSRTLSYENYDTIPTEDELENDDGNSENNESTDLLLKDELATENDGNDEENVTNHAFPIVSNEAKKRKGWIKTPTNGIGRVAKFAKHGTAITSKQMVKQTVNATRFISKGIVHKKKRRQPSRKEPRVRTRKPTTKRKNRRRDHDVAVNKVMKNYSPSNAPGTILAAEMTAPDQSLRMVSHFLSDMTSYSVSVASQTRFNTIFSSKFGLPSELDAWFLKGGTAELGLTQSKSEGLNLLHEVLVARCLWETHWREEWCGLYPDHISFYVPLAKKAVFMLSLGDILGIRPLDLADDKNPLPGLPYLVIETLWRCHYLAFNFTKTRDSFSAAINSAIFSYGIGDPMIEGPSWSSGKDQSKEDWKLNQWANFRVLEKSSLSDGRGKWARISSSNKSKKRNVLNSRRMVFDVASFYPSLASMNDNKSVKITTQAAMAKFSEILLTRALSFSLNTTYKDVEGFANFLDLASRLRGMPLNILDLNSKEAYCIFVNIYHCLLQHALLLDGPPNKRSCTPFMRSHCYEIGGDVFSLAELECMVIRGELSLSVHSRPPFVDAPKSSKAYLIYSLKRVDAKVNFVLNNGSSSNMITVPVLKPENLDEQLQYTCTLYLQRNVTVDKKKRLITLPKVCEIYRNDFGDGVPLHCLTYCVQYLDESTQNTVMGFLNDESSGFLIKYQPLSDNFHPCLSQLIMETSS